jgi:thiosulfate/3-mercaptopyruvate sulfurtransferase
LVRGALSHTIAAWIVARRIKGETTRMNTVTNSVRCVSRGCHALAASLALAGSAGAMPGLKAPAAQFDSSLVVSTAWLAHHRSDSSLVILDLAMDEAVFRASHIPGAQRLAYGDIVVQQDLATGLSIEMPTVQHLDSVFEAHGVSNGSTIVLTGVSLWVTRAFLTLDYLGHQHVAILNGGVTRWRAEGRPLSAEVSPVARGHFVPHVHPEVVADAAWMQAHLRHPGTALIDTRTNDEYTGSGPAARGSTGHLAGARLMIWQSLNVGQPTEISLASPEALMTAFMDRAHVADTIVTYCAVGQRATFTYFIARVLGYPARMYDGSYEDWSKRRLPTVAGEKP